MASETAHLPLRFAVEHQLELEGLPTFHAFIIIWSMDKIKDLRHGRHCASAMHVHLVFVTKCRHCSFDGQAIEALRAIFSKVCTDFQAQLVELDGQRDHVHLLVNYPPKVSVSSLVNALKGVSSYVLRRRLPRIAKCYSRRMFCRRLLISPHPVAAHHSSSSSDTLNSRPHRYSRGLPRPEGRGLRHSRGHDLVGSSEGGWCCLWPPLRF